MKDPYIPTSSCVFVVNDTKILTSIPIHELSSNPYLFIRYLGERYINIDLWIHELSLKPYLFIRYLWRDGDAPHFLVLDLGVQEYHTQLRPGSERNSECKGIHYIYIRFIRIKTNIQRRDIWAKGCVNPCYTKSSNPSPPPSPPPSSSSFFSSFSSSSSSFSSPSSSSSSSYSSSNPDRVSSP
jgi:hypothetical protein